MDLETQEAILKNYQEQKYNRDDRRAPKKGKSKKKTPKKKSNVELDLTGQNLFPEVIGPKRAASAGHAQPTVADQDHGSIFKNGMEVFVI